MATDSRPIFEVSKWPSLKNSCSFLTNIFKYYRKFSIDRYQYPVHVTFFLSYGCGCNTGVTLLVFHLMHSPSARTINKKTRKIYSIFHSHPYDKHCAYVRISNKLYKTDYMDGTPSRNGEKSTFNENYGINIPLLQYLILKLRIENQH